MAGDLGLEPRMTVPKTVVLPLHHSPAGPVRRRSSLRRGAVRYAKLFGDATLKTKEFSSSGDFLKTTNSPLARSETRGYKPPPRRNNGLWPASDKMSECGSVW